MPKPSFIYLDNAATSWPKPPAVADAMARFLAESAGNAGRGGHSLARAASAVIDKARAAIAKLINAERPERVVLTHGCTDSINLALHGWITACRHKSGGAKSHVVFSSVEHNAVGRTIHLLELEGAIDSTTVKCDSEGFVPAEAVLAACNERTVLVCLSNASNACGTIQPVGDVGRGLRARSPDALFMVDGAQTVGHINVDVQRDCIDLLTIAGHKGLLGPTGTGAIYVGPRAFSDDCNGGGARLHCMRSGGTGARVPGLDMPTELPDALEAGTANGVGFAGLLAAIEHRPHGASEHETARIRELIDGLRSIPGIRIHGRQTADGRTPVVMFNLEGFAPRDLGGLLDGEFDIAVRAGLHCAPLLHQSLGTAPDGAVRVSPGFATKPEEVARFLDAMSRIARAR
ncbi:MAG TPA: aminotransferase class V-fold PLP-dependent enzyme [Phycisphaerales bacterium]|nr:aminotransferase class V-fold PLP-dependent enzyme [Phycisphaerales bacterium]